MTDYVITRTNTESGGALTATTAEATGQAKMTYSSAGTTQRIVDHTEVDESLRGMGAGLALATRMVEDARRDGVKLIPLCPFFLATAKKHPDWLDVVRIPG